MIIFIDCGAHCGESILRAKRQFGINTRIISFEPIPYFAEEIRKIWENDESVDVINAAVWIEEFLEENKDTWVLKERFTNNNGFTIIERIK